MEKNKEYKSALWYRIIRACFGLVGYAFGVLLTINANVGVAPWDVFALGLVKQLNITLGQATIAISIVVVIIDILIRERIGIGTILDAIIVGTTMDIIDKANIIPVIENNLLISLLMITVGLFLMAIFQYFYMSAALSCGPRDSLLVGLGRLLPKVPIGMVLIGLEAIVLAIGWVLGGPVGIGTLFCVVFVGLIMQLVFNIIKFEPRNVVHMGFSIGQKKTHTV